MKYVIIGAGAAGVNAAEIIKKNDPAGNVVIIGAEKYFPYNRYLLTDFLCDRVQIENLFYASADSLKMAGIEFRKGEYVKEIDPGKKSIKLVHNEIMHYDKLLIAAGASPWLGKVVRPFQKFIQRYCSLQDVCLLKQALPGIRDCIVSGPGLSSLDLICGLYKSGKKITFIIDGIRPDWPLPDKKLAGELYQIILDKGIEIVPEDRITAIEKPDDRCLVSTLKQRKLSADIVFCWDDYVPNVSFLKGTGIRKKTGILVNEYLETNLPDIYAAGDCVEIYHPGCKCYRTDYGWPNALEQGEAAAWNMTGQHKAYRVHDSLELNLAGKPLKARWWK